MKDPSMKQDATYEKVTFPRGQSIQKAVVPSMADVSDENSFKREDRKQADGRT